MILRRIGWVLSDTYSGRTEKVRMVVVKEKCGSKLSVPIWVLGKLKFCWGWDMAYSKGCSSVSAAGFAKTTLPAAYIIHSDL